jgi:hypothetical protein
MFLKCSDRGLGAGSVLAGSVGVGQEAQRPQPPLEVANGFTVTAPLKREALRRAYRNGCSS